jgi:Type IV pili methyl-accepting chemotaxis transducer N-term
VAIVYQETSMPPTLVTCCVAPAMRAALLGATLATACAMPVAAETQPNSATLTLAQFVKETGGTARINLSAKLRMLSQRIAADACVYGSHGDDAQTVEGLMATLDEFQKIMTGLEVGDESLGILGPEESAKALKGLKILAQEWALIDTEVRALIASGGNDTTKLALIYEQEPKVLKIAQKLTVEIGALYTDPNSLTIGSAMAIDIAGRQRMLLQKMTKEACQISTGAGTAETPAQLRSTVDTFDTTLTAMIDGLPEAGMPPAPTPAIRDAIEAVKAEWQTARAPFDAAIAGETLDPAALAALRVATNSLVKSLNKIVADYAASATF